MKIRGLLFGKLRLHVVIPSACLLFWAFLAVYMHGFFIDPIDFSAYYYAGKHIFTNPELVYNYSNPSTYFYLPCIAVMFSIFSLWDIYFSAWLYYIVLIFFGLASIFEFRALLELKGVHDKLAQMICLLVLVNGHRLLQQYDLLNVKVILMFLIIVFIKREVSRRNFEKQGGDYKFHTIQYVILGFFIAMVPPFIFICILYLLNNVSLRNALGKSRLIQYGIFIMVLLIQNFMFFIYPSLIMDFLAHGMQHVKIYNGSYSDLTPEFILQNKPDFSESTLLTLGMILGIDQVITKTLSIILLSLFTLLLLSRMNMSVEHSFAWFFLFSLFFNVYIKNSNFLFMVPIILLLFTDQVNLRGEFETKKDMWLFAKKNPFFLLALFVLFLLIFTPPTYFVYKTFYSVVKFIPVAIFLLFWTYFYMILLTCYFFLKRNRVRERAADSKNVLI